MKMLLILLVLLGLAYYFFFYKKGSDEPKPDTAAATPAATADTPPPAATVDPHSFDTVLALLRQDMNAIPVPLDGPGRSPTNAMAIRRKVRPFLNAHVEYQTITQACDLIIRADTQRNAFQASCHAEQTRAGFSNSLSYDLSIHTQRAAKEASPTPTPSTEETQRAIHQRIEGAWSSYRADIAAQVQGLLGSLAGRHL